MLSKKLHGSKTKMGLKKAHQNQKWTTIQNRYEKFLNSESKNRQNR